MFERAKHVYNNPNFVEFIKDSVRFFNGTPVHQLPPPSFTGVGVYALYYTGSESIYLPYFERNRLAFNEPIYCGKAVPKGWRQGRTMTDATATELNRRLAEHCGSIAITGFPLDDFHCRFSIFEGDCADLISTVEAALIKYYRPLWNVCVDGFGNHDPGQGRYKQARSAWDVLHPGRIWANKCTGVAVSKTNIEKSIHSFYETRGWL